MFCENINIRLFVENVGDFEIDNFIVLICGQEMQVICDVVLLIGEGRYFDVSFANSSNIEESVTIKTMIVNTDGAILTEDEFVLRIKYTDINMQVSMSLANGKQNFTVELQNVSNVDSDVTLEIFINGELKQKHTVLLLSKESNKYNIIFENVNKGDYIYFRVTSNENEINTFNNSLGLFSILTEQELTEFAQNPYYESLNNGKQFLG